MSKNKFEEHLDAAGIAFDLLLFLPIFISNIAGIFSKDVFAENSLYFPAIFIIDMIYIAVYYSNVKDKEYRGEGMLYLVLLIILGFSLIGMSIAYALTIL
ncbi:hypothetical protein [Oceanobacillus sp. FSL W7-1293]|uniref:hypothetical protein n=1 Tax=Oceanobacillus sp. FSL W7-1293 TaxID=2921699 RepID=UPI0030CDE112